MIGDHPVETMMGSRINQLSPITKKMNKIAKSTHDQIEMYAKKQKINEELRETLWLKMQTAKNKDSTTDSAGGDTMENTAKAILLKNSQQIKIL
jgi:hypothetical protein